MLNMNVTMNNYNMLNINTKVEHKCMYVVEYKYRC